jgi:hypothetical protein
VGERARAASRATMRCMSALSTDFEKKLIEAHKMKEPLPVCPPPCHGHFVVEGGTDGADTTLKCAKCGAGTSYARSIAPRAP